MRRPKIIGLLVVPLFSFGLACCLPQKATAEEVRLRIGLIQVSCNTVSQRCYTPDGSGGWLYFSTISDIPHHQGQAADCANAGGGNWLALKRIKARGINCSRYGYSIPEALYREQQQEWDRTLDRLQRLNNSY